MLTAMLFRRVFSNLNIRTYYLPFVPDFYINSNDRKKHTVYNFSPLKIVKTCLSTGWSLWKLSQVCLSAAISCVRWDDKSHHPTCVAMAGLLVGATQSPALCSQAPLHSAGCRQKRTVHTALDRDTQSSDPLCVMQGPPGSWSLSQAVFAAVATR